MPFVVGLAQHALAAMNDAAREVMAALLQVAHGLDLPAVRLVIDVGEDMHGLEDPSVVRERVTELRRVAAVSQLSG